MARTGKTSLAAQLTTHNPDRAYYHTNVVKYFYCNGKQLIRSFALRKVDRDSIKVKAYGMQIQDTPGELTEEVVPDTAEFRLVRNLVVTNPTSTSDAKGYQQGLPESVPLLSDARDRSNQNSLVKTLGTMGYIVVFDLSNASSFEKAQALIVQIRERIVENVPIVLLGNKIDIVKTSDEIVERMIEDGQQLADTHKIRFYIGTILGNEFQQSKKKAQSRPPLTVQELVHNMAVSIHARTELWRTNDYTPIQRSTTSQDESVEDSSGFFDYLCCCACFRRTGQQYRAANAEKLSV